MNERIKELRKALGLTLEKFATPLGVQRSAINKIEKGENRVSDQMFLSICREYNVNPDWLESGTGSMFLEIPIEDEFSEAAKKLSGDPLVVSCLVEYSKLLPEEQAIIRKYIENLMKRYKEGPR